LCQYKLQEQKSIYTTICINEHRLASINYLTNRLTAYPFTHDEKVNEENIITQMLKANGYDVKILNTNGRVKLKVVSKSNPKKGPYLHILGMKYVLSPKYLPNTMSR
jgi:hypothetical protein